MSRRHHGQPHSQRGNFQTPRPSHHASACSSSCRYSPLLFLPCCEPKRAAVLKRLRSQNTRDTYPSSETQLFFALDIPKYVSRCSPQQVQNSETTQVRRETPPFCVSFNLSLMYVHAEWVSLRNDKPIGLPSPRPCDASRDLSSHRLNVLHPGHEARSFLGDEPRPHPIPHAWPRRPLHTARSRIYSRM